MTQFLNRMQTSLRQLRWKLTLSYTAVTVSALLVVVLLLAAYVFSNVLLPKVVLTPEFSEMWAQAAGENSGLMPIVRRLLAASPPDTAGIAELVSLAEDNATFDRLGLLRIGGIQLYLDTNAEFDALVFGADGSLLGRTGYPAFPNTGQAFDASTIPGLEVPLQAALAGERDPKRLVAMNEPENELLVAVPVFGLGEARDQVLGALAYVVVSLPTQADTLSHTVQLVGRALLIFLLGGGIMGAIFGSFTAQSMVRRFRRLSAATDAWSQGDFSEFIDDPNGDEISQLAQSLNGMAEQLQTLLKRRQEMAVSEERNRLARDLHDSAKQQAFAASAQLGAVVALFEQDPQAAKPHLLEAEKLVDKVRKELTSLILELRPVDLKRGGLAVALREYSIDWAHHSDIEIDIQVEGERALPLEVEQTLFRIAQEALANTARHSQAGHAEILLVYNPDCVTLTIVDDGRGFNTSDVQGGMGLRSMRERAELIGGELIIESALGEGTLVAVRCAGQASLGAGCEA